MLKQKNGRKSIAISLIISILVLGIIFWQKDNLMQVISGFIGNSNKAVLTITPSSGTFKEGDNFNADIYLNTAGNNVVAVDAYLSYNPSDFEVLSVDTSNSEFARNNACVYQGKFCQLVKNNTSNGTVEIIEGKPTPGVNKSNALIARLRVRAKKNVSPNSDNFTFNFSGPYKGKSRVILDDGQGTDILSGVKNAKYAVYAQPACNVGASCTTDINCPGKYDSSCFCTDVQNDSCPSADIVFYDSFNRNNLGNWQIIPLNNAANKWQVSSGTLSEKSDSGESIALAPNFSVPAVYTKKNYQISFKAKSIGDKNNGYGLVFGYVNKNNYDMLLWNDPSGHYGEPALEIIRVKNGAVTVLTKKEGEKAGNGVWYSISLSVSGNKISAKVNGREKLNASASFSPGRIGFYSTDNDDGVLFDYITYKAVPVSVLRKIKRIKLALEARHKFNTSASIIILRKGTNNVVKRISITSPDNGIKEVDFSDIPDGTYDIKIKVPHYLPKEERNISIVAGQAVSTIDFSGLLAGNLQDSDDIINSLDWSIMGGQWGRRDKPVADINQDGIVNSLDWYYLSKNWGKTSSN